MSEEQIWEAVIEDVDEITNSKGALITKAKDNFFENFGEKPINAFQDSYGLIAYEYKTLILCSKDYIYGNIVSCHKELVNVAKAKGKKLVMFINKANVFYSFDVDKILLSGVDNKRGGKTMINFKINLSEKYQQ